MTITEKEVNEAFDAYLEAFNTLAEQEDLLEDMRGELDEYKEGGSKHVEAQRKIAAFERAMTEPARNLRKAALQLDRIKTLVAVQKA